MTTPARPHYVSIGEEIAAHFAARGWSPADLRSFRMEAGSGGEGDGGAGDGGTGGDSGASDGSSGSDRGYPPNTPVAEMTAEQQAAYWKHHARQHERTAQSRADYDDLKAKAARLAEIEAANATEQEKAIRAAVDQAIAEQRNASAPRLVGAEFRAAAKGVLTDEQRDALLEDLDLTKYLTDKGEVDIEKVERKVKAFAPASSGTGNGAPGTGGQGRQQQQKTSARDAGRAEAQKRFGTPAGAQK